jgi:hypothetical protein
MDYHSDRFKDYSLMVYDADNKLISVIPANFSDNQIISHEGLTYGGFVLNKQVKLMQTLSVVFHTLKFLNEHHIETFILKCFPRFYNVHSTDEIEYALFLLNAELYRRDIAFIIDLQNRVPYSGNIKRESNKAERLQLKIKEDDTLDIFWNEVLSPNLEKRYGVKPVHSLNEIRLLKSRFPELIKQYNVYYENQVVAGATLFFINNVAHCQYISSTEYGRKAGCLNYLFKTLLDKICASCRHFDFGIVNENGGKSINRGMLFWKESFGGRAQLHDFYKIRTSAYKNLESLV